MDTVSEMKQLEFGSTASFLSISSFHFFRPFPVRRVDGHLPSQAEDEMQLRVVWSSCGDDSWARLLWSDSSPWTSTQPLFCTAPVPTKRGLTAHHWWRNDEIHEVETTHQKVDCR